MTLATEERVVAPVPHGRAREHGGRAGGEAARPRRDRSAGRPRIPQARAADFNIDGGVASHRRAGRLQGIGGEGYSSGAVFFFEYISEYLFCATCFVEYLVEYLFLSTARGGRPVEYLFEYFPAFL